MKIEGTLTTTDELVDDVLTKVLMVIDGGKTTWDADATMGSIVVTCGIPSVAVYLFLNKCLGSLRVGIRP